MTGTPHGQIPPRPTVRPQDWLDDILNSSAETPAPVPPPAKEQPAPSAEPEGEQQPRMWARAWDAFTSRVSPWKAVLALVAAMIPIPWTGYSAAVTWAYTVSEARAMHQGFGYALAFGTFLLAARRLARTRSLLALWCTAVTFIGLFSAMSWYDPIQWLTGVHK
jgi:hypothetical protein